MEYFCVASGFARLVAASSAVIVLTLATAPIASAQVAITSSRGSLPRVDRTPGTPLVTPVYFDGEVIGDVLAESLQPSGLLGWGYVKDGDGTRIAGQIVLHFLEEDSAGRTRLISAVLTDQKERTGRATGGLTGGRAGLSITPAGAEIAGYPVSLRLERTLATVGVSESTGRYLMTWTGRSKFYTRSVLSLGSASVTTMYGPTYEATIEATSSGYSLEYVVRAADGSTLDEQSMSVIAAVGGGDACTSVGEFAANASTTLTNTFQDGAIWAAELYIAVSSGAAGAVTGLSLSAWQDKLLSANDVIGDVIGYEIAGPGVELMCRELTEDNGYEDLDDIQWQEAKLFVEMAETSDGSSGSCPDGTVLAFGIVDYVPCGDDGEIVDGALVVESCAVYALGCIAI